MGNNTDFYKLKPGVTLCSALDSSNKFLWSATLDGDYIDAGDYGNHKGGSLKFWPEEIVDGDERLYLPFWGQGQINDGTDGCYHLKKYGIDDGWGLVFKIFVFSKRIGEITSSRQDVETTLCYKSLAVSHVPYLRSTRTLIILNINLKPPTLSPSTSLMRAPTPMSSPSVSCYILFRIQSM